MNEITKQDLTTKYTPSKQMQEGQSTAMKRKMAAQREIENRRINTDMSKEYFEQLWEEIA